MPSTGVLTATSVLQVGDGPAYTNASNAEVLDGVFATVSIGAGANAEGLALYTYGAAVPGTATIVGVEVPFTAKSSTAGTTVVGVTLIYSFGVISAELTSSTFTTSNATYTLGGPANLWSATLTPAIVNDATFGIVAYVSTGTAVTASVDSGQINIYYTLPNVSGTFLLTMGCGS